jgi:putative transposase
MFEREQIEALSEIFTRMCESFDVQLAQVNGESDHVHLLVNSLKGVSSRLLQKQCPTLEAMYLTNVLWSRRYFAAAWAARRLKSSGNTLRNFSRQGARLIAEDKERTRKLEGPWQPMVRGLPAR